MASPLDAVAVKYLSLVRNFLKDDQRKLMQFLRVQRLLTMQAIQPQQWIKLVSELFLVSLSRQMIGFILSKRTTIIEPL